MNKQSKTQSTRRRIACHEVISPTGNSKTLQVVELTNGYVVSQHPLDGEEANTEWLQGTIRLKQDEKGIRAWYQEQPLT